MTTSSDFDYLKVACSKSVVKRAARIALIVGVILAIINHGDSLLQGNIDLNRMFKILLTFCVPYAVSTYSSCLAIRENNRTERVSQQ
ncbi:MAG: nitrate/nitrite transporter NrtS [Sulfitobacter sp.]